MNSGKRLLGLICNWFGGKKLKDTDVYSEHGSNLRPFHESGVKWDIVDKIVIIPIGQKSA